MVKLDKDNLDFCIEGMYLVLAVLTLFVYEIAWGYLSKWLLSDYMKSNIAVGTGMFTGAFAFILVLLPVLKAKRRKLVLLEQEQKEEEAASSVEEPTEPVNVIKFEKD